MAAAGVPARRGELDQHARARPWMQERDLAREARARCFIEELDPPLLERLQLAGHVGRLEAQVMQALAALVEEPAHARRWRQRLQQLDLRIARCQQGRAHTLVGKLGFLQQRQAEHVTIEPVRLLEAPHHDADVMNPSHHL
jgi:hypothetical protein